MKISIAGTGYVGLVTGTCFAEVGIDVVCVDIDQQKVENLKKGIIPIYEPGLEEMVQRNVKKDRLSFTTDLAESLEGADVVFSAVGTPPDEDGSADLKYVIEVARTVGKSMKDYVLMVTKSTVPVGTAEKVREAIKEELDKRGEDIPFDVASNPEFLKEGAAVEDFLKPDRIVVGLDSDRAEDIMKRLYKPFTLNGHPVIFMDIVSAEMTKYAANSMLATKISFMNDIANLCEIVGADVNMVRKGIGTDTRIGHKFIYPGAGYGGSCFPKDVKALIRTADSHGYSLRVLKSVEDVNESQKEVMFKKVIKYFGEDLKGKVFALWGLSFKPRTDDMREAPALVVIDKLLKAGAKVKGYDPAAMEESKRRIGDAIEYAGDQYEALIDADALIIMTEWNEFRYPNFNVMGKLLKNKVVFDGRNIYDVREMKGKGYDYYCIGLNTD
ncbi:MAG: UDP-glucose/GDP-mannose dehydrogenase family protein [Bacteroidales bacterium]|nr:UDP-glucose/GDP-mannose dehydrogenase family protein [Bacteroidales bacterium]MCF8344260.1 UDP-glucose/GDP-mannose dehydrogenase family protein [Bacteroidales bacterium]MCF8349909.1 UDP-glucose/GDP-mannose dehydrogenase family protein [Bacteroidales bacterium]MCF8376790.1 UDP-glucose/GDP-mannose dehydrogenase family protein [Bacteroidales bacterium]MCF8401977.1 UDP-glucose/GDP-mannose dehydrogenase family protein [Bacteroidales bacterium]